MTDRDKVDPGEFHSPVPGGFNGSVDRDHQSLANLTNANRVQITMSALASIAAHLAAIPGRKNLVWLTADLPFSGVAIARALGRADVAVYPVDARGLLPKALPGRIDDASSVPGLGVRPADPDARPRGQDTMEEVARETGGRAFINTNNLSEAIRSAVEDAAVTYTLGFYPDANLLDGKFHELKIRVKRGHPDLRYQKGYFALQDAQAQQTQSAATEAAQSPLEAARIHLLAQVEPVEQPKPGSLRISCTIDLRDLELAQSGDLQKGSAEVLVIQQDAAGRAIARESQILNLQLTRENYARLLKTGLFFRTVVERKDGLATLRVVVAGASHAATGSLIIPAAQIR